MGQKKRVINGNVEDSLDSKEASIVNVVSINLVLFMFIMNQN